MTESQRIVDQLRRAFSGDPWHGLPTTRLLDGLAAWEAAQRPVGGAASIWEIVLHMKAWIGEVHRRLLGGNPALPGEGDWPALGETTEDAWRDCVAALTSVHEALLADLGEFPENRLWEVVGDRERSREVGAGVSYYVMLHGLVQHNVYHTAQIGMLRRILNEQGPS
jgi:hypothetical protein